MKIMYMNVRNYNYFVLSLDPVLPSLVGKQFTVWVFLGRLPIDEASGTYSYSVMLVILNLFV